MQQDFAVNSTSKSALRKSCELYPPDGLWVDVVLKWLIISEGPSAGDVYISKTRYPVLAKWDHARTAPFKDSLESHAANMDNIRQNWPRLADRLETDSATCETVSIRFVHKDGSPYDVKVLERCFALSNIAKRST